jgi:hypothetical protein
MRALIGLSAILLVTAGSWAQQIPAGTVLPAMLNNSLDSNKSKAGEEISARLMQDVPLPDGGKIKRGSRVLGRVVSVSPNSAGRSPARVVVQFDRVEFDRQELRVTTSLQAVASMQAVALARQPLNPNGGNGTTSWDWNMRQIGGQVAFNGQRIVKAQNEEVVGTVVEPGAVVGIPLPNPARGCAGATNSKAEQAFWLFSTDACGVYGYKDLRLDRSASPGQITFQSPKSITVRGGSGWLFLID